MGAPGLIGVPVADDDATVATEVQFFVTNHVLISFFGDLFSLCGNRVLKKNKRLLTSHRQVLRTKTTFYPFGNMFHPLNFRILQRKTITMNLILRPRVHTHRGCKVNNNVIRQYAISNGLFRARLTPLMFNRLMFRTTNRKRVVPIASKIYAIILRICRPLRRLPRLYANVFALQSDMITNRRPRGLLLTMLTTMSKNKRRQQVTSYGEHVVNNTRNIRRQKDHDTTIINRISKMYNILNRRRLNFKIYSKNSRLLVRHVMYDPNVMFTNSRLIPCIFQGTRSLNKNRARVRVVYTSSVHGIFREDKKNGVSLLIVERRNDATDRLTLALYAMRDLGRFRRDDRLYLILHCHIKGYHLARKMNRRPTVINNLTRVKRGQYIGTMLIERCVHCTYNNTSRNNLPHVRELNGKIRLRPIIAKLRPRVLRRLLMFFGSLQPCRVIRANKAILNLTLMIRTPYNTLRTRRLQSHTTLRNFRANMIVPPIYLVTLSSRDLGNVSHHRRLNVINKRKSIMLHGRVGVNDHTIRLNTRKRPTSHAIQLLVIIRMTKVRNAYGLNDTRIRRILYREYHVIRKRTTTNSSVQRLLHAIRRITMMIRNIRALGRNRHVLQRFFFRPQDRHFRRKTVPRVGDSLSLAILTTILTTFNLATTTNNRHYHNYRSANNL